MSKLVVLPADWVDVQTFQLTGSAESSLLEGELHVSRILEGEVYPSRVQGGSMDRGK